MLFEIRHLKLNV